MHPMLPFGQVPFCILGHFSHAIPQTPTFMLIRHVVVCWGLVKDFLFGFAFLCVFIFKWKWRFIGCLQSACGQGCFLVLGFGPCLVGASAEVLAP
jgi:hypothetical protein